MRVSPYPPSYRFNVQLGYGLKMGTEIGIRLVR
jgi:hypothetical protein